jgi:sugar/nucleoside kinase (ribokinase family)
MTLVVLGDLMVDVIARAEGPLARGSDTPASVSLAGGGSGANVAAWAAALGTPVRFACRVGDDPPGRRAVDTLLQAGIKVHAAVDRERPTGTCVVLVEPDGERTMLPDAGANDAPVDVPDAWLEPGRHLHVVGYSLLRDGARPGALAAIERAQAASMTVSVDPSSWALIREGAIPPVDLLLPNEREADVLGEHCEMVVKLGPQGARWGNVHVPAEPVEVVDTTGAGDAFAAGLLGARLKGAEKRAALEAGCAAAARVVSQVGARPS